MSTFPALRHPGRGRAVFDTTRQIEVAAGAGYSFLMALDHLGARVLSWREQRRIAAANKQRIAWTSWVVAAGVTSLVAVLGVGVVSNISDENAWLTAGPAGAASAAAVPIAATTTALSSSANAPRNAQSSTTRKESSNMLTKSTAAKTIATGLTGALAVAGGTAALAAPAGAARVPAAKHASAVVHKTLVIQSSGRKGWPEYVNSKDIVLPKNSTVVLTIDSHDDGAAPLPKNVIFYDKVMGTVGGKEKAGGKTLSDVSNKVISHTFTIPQLGINLPIPAAPTGKVIVVQATIHTGKAGTYSWQCYAPCGTGKNSEHGPMDASGYMKGTVTIK
ncbi:MAG: hypothetical protein M0004_07580 [Actinomycetota bacterium]|nr:hypothetical protein [Actinomycetota bacterium]